MYICVHLVFKGTVQHFGASYTDRYVKSVSVSSDSIQYRGLEVLDMFSLVQDKSCRKNETASLALSKVE